MNLTSMPSIGTIEYIREKGLEYKPSEYIISTYLDLARCMEEEYNNKSTIMNKDKKKMFLRKLLNVYENLYFFKCDETIHNLLMSTFQQIIELDAQ